jgi:hypothetical protein
MPPATVMRPQTAPRKYGVPRPDSFPSSASASAKPIEMPAPSDAAIPTWNAVHGSCVPKAAANTGANVETEPSIKPTRPGWTIWRTKLRLALASSLPLRHLAGVSLLYLRPFARVATLPTQDHRAAFGPQRPSPERLHVVKIDRRPAPSVLLAVERLRYLVNAPAKVSCDEQSPEHLGVSQAGCGCRT